MFSSANINFNLYSFSFYQCDADKSCSNQSLTYKKLNDAKARPKKDETFESIILTTVSTKQTDGTCLKTITNSRAGTGTSLPRAAMSSTSMKELRCSLLVAQDLWAKL